MPPDSVEYKMLDRIKTISEDLAEARKEDPELRKLMDAAVEGQSPRFFLISPIDRASQDLDLFQFKQGYAFSGTRVPTMPLPEPAQSPILFAGPAAYTSQFSQLEAVVITFESDDSTEIVTGSLDSIAQHPALAGLPIVALNVDYLSGSAEVIPHNHPRDHEQEEYMMNRIEHPNYLDESLLTVLCSDSRVRPPESPLGVSMSIQTLGAFVPQYQQNIVECVQLDSFLSDWLSNKSDEKKIIVAVHGNFEDTGPSCGAGAASLNLDMIEDGYLRTAISSICSNVSRFEKTPAKSAEERVVNLGKATLDSLASYPSIRRYQEQLDAEEGFMEIMKMDTVTNVLQKTESS